MKIHNFSAGPSILPQVVFQEASEAVLNFSGMGMSILEISHRSPQFDAVMDETTALVHELLGVGEDYEILFLSGGASTQFFMTAMNFLNAGQTGYYIDTGTWSAKAIKEAKLQGTTAVLASSKETGYKSIPKDFEIPSDGRYLHVTSNNTIFGTQYRAFPKSPIPMIVDMSSDIFSREVDVTDMALIYAGAQKNMGPAGVTLVALRKDFAASIEKSLPTMLDYRTHIAKNSMFNTPPVFPIYVSMLNLRWLKAQGGVKVMGERNAEKARVIYEAIDNNPLFTGVVAQEDRSHMNATFKLINEGLESTFLDMCDQAGVSGVKGHRSVGGFRASMYNAMPVESVRALVDVMDALSAQHG